MKTIFINTDGTIDTTTAEGFKVNPYCGDWTILHTIYEIYSLNSQRHLPDELTLYQASFRIKDIKTNKCLPLHPKVIPRILQFIVKPEEDTNNLINLFNKSLIDTETDDEN